MPEFEHLLDLESLSKEQLVEIFNTAEGFLEVLKRPIPRVPSLQGVTVLNLFYEASTRTRFSFELAEKRLSADSITFSTATSSVKKGETLLDTVRNIEAMRVDMIVIRHSSPGAPHFLAKRIKGAVINAGDGTHEHPTQGLLDLFTMQKYVGDLKNKKILIVGDILHSRVARSNIWGLKKMGADVHICAPPTFLPFDTNIFGITVHYNLDEILGSVDVVMALRIQKEREDRPLIPDYREYRKLYGLTYERISKLKKVPFIMHPGPMNRSVEIDPEVADSPYSIILDQVTHGVAIRMAVLYLLSGRKERNV